MRPPSHVTLAVVLLVASLGGVALVDAAGPDAPRASVAGDPVVPTEDNGTYWRGQVLAFSVGAVDSYEVRTADDGLFVTELAPSNGSAVLDTAPLDAGTYVLSRNASAPAAYRFEVAEQMLSATASSDGVAVGSNRASYSLVVESPALSADQLRSLFPAATDRNGSAVVPDVGPDETVATNASAVPDGEYEIGVRVLDTDANATVSLSVSSSAKTTSELTTETTARPTTGTTTSDGTATTEAASPTGVPGFGVPIAVLAVALGLGVPIVGRER